MNTDHQKSRMVPELLLEASRRPRNQQHTARYQQTHSYCCAAAAALLRRELYETVRQRSTHTHTHAYQTCVVWRWCLLSVGPHTQQVTPTTRRRTRSTSASACIVAGATRCAVRCAMGGCCCRLAHWPLAIIDGGRRRRAPRAPRRPHTGRQYTMESRGP
jgi:hypothetical protein